MGDGFTAVPAITTDAGKAMKGADLVLMMGPTHAHAAMAEVVAPHLTKSQILFAAPGHTLTVIPNTLRRFGHKQPLFADCHSLPYICRKTRPDAVRVTRKAQLLHFAAFPGNRTAELADQLKPLFPTLRPRETILDTVFPYTNAVHHPPALLCNVGRVESTGGDYFHYYDGITPSVGKMIDALDRERVAVSAAFDSRVPPLPEHFFQMGYTNEVGRDEGTAYAVFHNSEPNKPIRAPQSIDHRFFNEDIPYGLMPLAALGKLANLDMPVTQSVITLASVVTGKPYRDIGLTLERLGIDGMNVASLKKLLWEGFGE